MNQNVTVEMFIRLQSIISSRGLQAQQKSELVLQKLCRRYRELAS